MEQINDVKLLIYGFPGAGKTQFLATANEDIRTSPILWLDLEGGTRTFNSRVKKITINEVGSPEEGKIDVVRLRSWEDIQAAYEYLHSSKYAGVRDVYKSVVLDSLTEINSVALIKCLGESAKRLEPGVPEQRDYLKTNNLMKKLIRGLRDIENLNVFLTALPKESKDTEGGVIQIVPDLIGKLALEAIAMVDFGVYLRVNTTKKCRELHFEPKGKALAKRRDEFNRLNEPLIYPTMTRFLDALTGVKTIEQLNKETVQQ